MSHVTIHASGLHLREPFLVDGLPGLGLVGKIATDHLIAEFGMTYYASIECPSLPPVVAYQGKSHEALPGVRIYADEGRDLLALQSDVAVSPYVVSDFASCLTTFLVNSNALPMYFSGLARPDEADPDRRRSLYGIATGMGDEILRDIGIDPPAEPGIWSGPTGALLNLARFQGINALGLIVESDAQFPDPEAACILIERVIEPVTGVDVNVQALREKSDEIREEKKTLADQMSQPEENESSRSESLGMYQ